MGVATAIAIGGLAMSAASTASSFVQAANQKKNAAQAQRDAENAMIEARRKLEPNYYAKLAVQKEPYYLQMEAAKAEAAQAIEAAREQPRGVAATAGRVQLALNEMGGEVRSAMGKEMSDLDKLKAQEDSRLRDIGVQLDLEEVAGQQQMAADAQAAAAAATSQGWQGVTSMGQQALQMVPLFPGSSKGDTKIAAPKAPSAEAMARTKTPLKLSPDQIPKIEKPKTISTNPFQYSQSTKFGQPIKTPLWSQDYNYFNF